MESLFYDTIVETEDFGLEKSICDDQTSDEHFKNRQCNPGICVPSALKGFGHGIGIIAEDHEKTAKNVLKRGKYINMSLKVLRCRMIITRKEESACINLLKTIMGLLHPLLLEFVLMRMRNLACCDVF